MSMRRILYVAEKNDVAKGVANILSAGLGLICLILRNFVLS